jgi:hypothetical protein
MNEEEEEEAKERRQRMPTRTLTAIPLVFTQLTIRNRSFHAQISSLLE